MSETQKSAEIAERANLTSKVALITGASRGIGLASARALAQAGARLVLCARSADRLERETQALRAAGAQAIGLVCDVSQRSDVEAAVARACDVFGGLDILVNNAGVIDPIARLAESDPDAWCEGLDVNVKGVYFGLRAALPVMEAQGRGVIVNLSSGAAYRGLEGWSQYCAAKAAVLRLTECAHIESEARGVRVVGLSPGTVATDMQAAIKASGVNRVSELAWDQHIAPEWVGQAVVFLCGPGGAAFAGRDFSLKTPEGRRLAGLPVEGAPDA